MKAILSCTDDELYSFFLPITTWSWHKIGIRSVVFIPKKRSKQFELAMSHCPVGTMWFEIDVAKDREPTYFQCARLFGGFLSLPKDEILIVGDADMAVFGNEFEKATSDKIHLWGTDLVPVGQVPMCYVAMSIENWRIVMDINEGDTYMECLEKLLGDIHVQNMRGNYWCKDQETIHDRVYDNNIPIVTYPRARGIDNKSALRREDRDGWGQGVDIIDAHLPRPGTETNNFYKILDLFVKKYGVVECEWMEKYWKEFKNT